MEYKTNKKENSSVEIIIKNSRDEVEKAYQEAFDKAIKHLKLPGFRAGKVPRKVAENYLGEKISHEAAQFLIEKTFRSIAPKLKPPAISIPTFNVDSFDRQKGAIYSGYYDTYPEIKIGKYKKIKILEDVGVVSDALIDQEMMQVQLEHSHLQTRESDEAVQLNDKVTLEIEIFKGKNSIFESKEFIVEVGDKINYPGLNECIVGLKCEEETSYETEFEADFPNKNLSGKKVKIGFKIVQIQYMVKPELDDAFAGELGDFRDMDHYKLDLRKEMEKRCQEFISQKSRSEIMEKIRKDAKITVPTSLTEREKERRIKIIKSRLGVEELSMAELAQRLGQNVSELNGELDSASLRNIEEELILSEIAKKENITINADEVDEEIVRKFGNMLSGEQLKEWKNRENLRENIKTSLIYSRALDWLYKHADINKGKEFPCEKLNEQGGY